MASAVERTVAELREAAGRVLEFVSLEQVFLARSHLDLRIGRDQTELKSAYVIQTRAEQNNNGLIRSWIKYSVFALEDDPEDPLPGETDELTEEQIESHHVWKIDMEWVAEFSGDPDKVSRLDLEDLSAFTLVMGPPTIHPYARDLAQSLTARGPYPAFTLGLLKPVSALPDEIVIRIEGNGPDTDG